MKDKILKFREYLNYVESHYDNVQKAWAEINKKCENKGFRFMYDDFVWHTINDNIKNHDASKLSKEEFTQYRQYFFPTEMETKDKNLFDSAWANHLEKNGHHWQNWTVNDANDPYSAEVYLIENICDWMAMGYEFGDTAKEYYENNKHKIDIPDWGKDLMYDIFKCVYSESK